ncbi:F-box-like protein [Ceratobasidium sp. AG-Ba]|nr:F-box-like protein [Ceratobasidium sp. AG-Ba]
MSPSNRAKKEKTQHVVVTGPPPPLPTEVLGRIFTESIRCSRPTSIDGIRPGASPVTLAGVCQQWRRVAFDCRQIWTGIDLVLNVVDKTGKYLSPTIWAEHSQGAPLDVRVFQYHVELESFNRDEMDEMDARYGRPRREAPMTRRLIEFLLPLAPQIRSLDLFLRWPYESILTRVLNCWVTHGNLRRTKSLAVHNDNDSRHLDLPIPKQHQSFFESLEVLDLHGTAIPWANFPCKNIKTLTIGVGKYADGSVTIALPTLAVILARCPGLQHLKLNYVGIEPSAKKIKAVLLKHLRSIRIGGCGGSRSALAIIDPGESEPSVDISLYSSGFPQFALKAAIGEDFERKQEAEEA